MAKSSVQIPALCAELVEDARKGIFKPVYLLMGDEPYYPDLVCSAVVENCVEESFKDFNEYIFYGADTDADTVVSAARQYPMMSERILGVVKEAQLMKDIETLQYYCQQPLDSTVLVVLLHKGAVDKRKAFYKSVQKCGGAIVESPSLRDYEIADWIVRYYRSHGLNISPEAATLMGESTGTELGTIVVETDKLVKNLPEGVELISEAGDLTVSVTVINAETRTFDFNETNINVTGVGTDRSVVIQNLDIKITAKGMSTVIETLTNDSFELTADISDLEVGTHSVELKVTCAQDGVDSIKCEPEKIDITIEAME